MMVVGIGASAGGLEACGKLLDAMPANPGVAFILVQHLDPTHESMMVELLSTHTSMNVVQAADGMPIERDHLYVIPPGTSLSVTADTLHLSEPIERHGSRLPFDFLLHSLAETYGARAICIVLSGTGFDGTVGLKAVKNNGGFAIAQDPLEATYDGMPRSAIATGNVDLVLRVCDMPTAVVAHANNLAPTPQTARRAQTEIPAAGLARIIDLVHTKTPHDFRLYKTGTMQRRIERRMTMAGVAATDVDQYLALLQAKPEELDHLAEDLLINVTAFFRDPAVFETLAKTVIPDLVLEHNSDQPIRIWVAGCSTGEEAYSLAILFREHLTSIGRTARIQIFASDADSDAVARAREGFFPTTIAGSVSAKRLDRFFTKDSGHYRVTPDLRSDIVFTVHDLLADPPFSRLDMVSCRNLLIYLQPEAQAKVLALFHFSLRPGGVLLLGSSETIGEGESQFSLLSKRERLYRHIDNRDAEDRIFPIRNVEGARPPARQDQGVVVPRLMKLADLCRRVVLENYAPAAVLINRKHECLYAFGPTDRYLRVPPGVPTHDLLAMAREGLRSKLKQGIQQAEELRTRVAIAEDGIDIHPVTYESEDLLLVCFVDAPPTRSDPTPPVRPEDSSQVLALERELATVRADLQDAVRDLEISGQAQKAIKQEASSIAEEYQSTNEELVTSKEELQSLNEELTALNGQLHETLDRQRTTSNDLQNVLHSTDVAILFLDTELRIRFFTPAIRSLFNLIPGDIGRPLDDLNSLAADDTLLADARTVLQTPSPIERETRALNGAWFTRRTLPYRAQDVQVEGIVITFVDISEQKRIAAALDIVRQDAERATIAKSRFLAAASHDLRQPLQTLVLIQGMLSKTIKAERAQRLVTRLGATLSAMAGMLNTLLDINQIEAGNVRADLVDFPVSALLERMRSEFAFHAEEKGLTLRVVPSNQMVRSDPRLLEQILRNLLSNAVKYTERGKILLGCRRHDDTLSHCCPVNHRINSIGYNM